MYVCTLPLAVGTDCRLSVYTYKHVHTHCITNMYVFALPLAVGTDCRLSVYTYKHAHTHTLHY